MSKLVSLGEIVYTIMCFYGVEDVDTTEAPAVAKQFIAHASIEYGFPRKETAAILGCTTQYISQLANVVTRSIAANDPSYTRDIDLIYDAIDDGND